MFVLMSASRVTLRQGRDTAGLGGKGGPYRLDAGHDVHQLSQAEKDAVPEDVKQAAMELVRDHCISSLTIFQGRKAFEERLREINMSEYDAEVYNRYYDSVAREVRSALSVPLKLVHRLRNLKWYLQALRPRVMRGSG